MEKAQRREQIRVKEEVRKKTIISGLSNKRRFKWIPGDGLSRILVNDKVTDRTEHNSVSRNEDKSESEVKVVSEGDSKASESQITTGPDCNGENGMVEQSSVNELNKISDNASPNSMSERDKRNNSSLNEKLIKVMRVSMGDRVK